MKSVLIAPCSIAFSSGSTAINLPGSPCLVRCIGQCPHQNSSSIEVDIEPGKGGDRRHMTKADSGTADRIRERRGLVLSSGC